MRKLKLRSRLIWAVILLVVFISVMSPYSIIYAREPYVTTPMLSLNRFSTYVLKSDGTVLVAGHNAYGQLGINSTVSTRTLVSIPTLSNVKYLASGPESGATVCSSMFAVMSDGTVKGWGSNNYNQLGLGDTTNRLVPTTIPGLSNVSQIAIGGGHTLALINGEVWAWGYNNFGQCGDGLSINVTAPKKVNGVSNAIKVFAGTGTSYALLSNGTVMAWGNNAGNGGIGLASQKISKVLPTLIPNLANVRDMAVGYCTNFAILNDDTVRAWGVNSYYALGMADTAVPTVLPGLVSVKKISPGIMHTLVLFNNGTVKACGKNSQGEVGVGSQSIVKTFSAISGVANVSDISAGGDDSAAVLKDGTVKMWGQNYSGRFTLPNPNYLVPTIIQGMSIPMPAVDTPVITASVTTPVNTSVSMTVNFGNVATIKQYKIGMSDTWKDYTGPISIYSNCNVYAVGKDSKGNSSAEALYTITNIDTTIPTPPSYALSHTRLMFTSGTDNESGVKEIQYHIDGGPWVKYSNAVILTKGPHDFEAKTIDNAENESAFVIGTVEATDNKALEIADATNTYGTVLLTGKIGTGTFVPTQDGGYIINNSITSPTGHSTCIKYSSENIELWRVEMDFGNIVELSDGSLLAQIYTGEIVVPNMTAQQITNVRNNCILAKYDSKGKFIWTKRVGHAASGHITATPDGGFAALELVYYPNIWNNGTACDLRLLKYDADGKQTNMVSFGERASNCYKTTIATDNAIYIDYDDYNETGKYHLVKLSLDGNVIWDKTDLNFIPRIGRQKTILANDSGLIMVGLENKNGDISAYIAKIDFEGNGIWKTYFEKEGNQRALSVCETVDGYIMLGMDQPTNTVTDMFVASYDTYGNFISNKTFTGTGIDYGLNVLCTNSTLLISTNTTSRDGDYSFIPGLPAGNATVVMGLKGYGKSSAALAPVISPDTTEPTSNPVTLTITYPPTAVIKQFSEDGVNYSDYVSPILITANNTICNAKYKDASGTWSQVASYTVSNIIGEIKIDTPRIILSTTEPTNKPILVTIDYGNAAHGYYWTDDDNKPKSYTGPFTIYDNNHIYSKGTLGSLGSVNDLIIDNIDKLSPYPPTYSINEHKLILIAGVDLNSGVKEVQYRLDDCEWRTYTDSIDVTPGPHKIEAKTIDKAGNQSAILIETINVLEK